MRRKRNPKPWQRVSCVLTAIVGIFFFSSCGTSQTKPGSDNRILQPAHRAPVSVGTNLNSDEVSSLLERFNQRLLEVEGRLSSIDERIESTRLALDEFSVHQKLKQAEVLRHPSDRNETNQHPEGTPENPHQIQTLNGFVNNTAIGEFRNGWIIFQAKKYSDAILSFSQFVDKYPDHPLAGSAQYYVAKSYLNQNEFKLAEQEYQRILTSYTTDPTLTDTLRDLVTIEIALKNSEKASRYRQILSSVFAQSPANWELTGAAPSQPVEQKKELEKEKEKEREKIKSEAVPPTAPLEQHSLEQHSEELHLKENLSEIPSQDTQKKSYEEASIMPHPANP